MSEYLRKLDDPELENKRLRIQDHFELIYMRHGYFRRSTNPEPQRLAQFEEMICKISDKYYLKSIELYKEIGFEMDDLRNIGRINTVSFISMSGLKENPDKMEKFIERHKKQNGEDSEPNEGDIFRKECYDLARFLNQRLGELPTFCKRKISNIRGTGNVRAFFIGNSKKKPSDLNLYYSPEAYGYEQITELRYKELVKECRAKGKSEFQTADGQTVRAVYIKGSFLTKDDIEETGLDSGKSSFYRTPEENLMLKEVMYSNKKKDQKMVKEAFKTKKRRKNQSEE